MRRPRVRRCRRGAAPAGRALRQPARTGRRRGAAHAREPARRRAVGRFTIRGHLGGAAAYEAKRPPCRRRAGVETAADESVAEDYSEPSPTARDRSRAPVAAEEEPASEECDEASFFLEQGLTEEAREILETVLIALPGPRARRRADGAAGGARGRRRRRPPRRPRPRRRSVPAVEPRWTRPRRARRVRPRGGAGRASWASWRTRRPRPPRVGRTTSSTRWRRCSPSSRRAWRRSSSPRTWTRTTTWASPTRRWASSTTRIGEFTVARQGCVGKKKELDCLTMIGMLHGMKGEHAAAVKRFKEGAGQRARQGRGRQGAAASSWRWRYEAMGEHGQGALPLPEGGEAGPEVPRRVRAGERLAAAATPEDDPMPARKGADWRAGLRPRRCSVRGRAEGAQGRLRLARPASP